MANKDFIFQGFTPRTHVSAVRALFDLPKITKVLISVAFANRNGVDLIADLLDANQKVSNVFAGIRNEITSTQGLKRILETGATLHTVDTAARGVLFHPKIYLVRNDHHARLIIGSANLTLGGLNNNIEAGLVLDCDLGNANDKALVDNIEAQFNGLPKAFPDHIQRITKLGELDVMQTQGRLIDEATVSRPWPVSSIKSSAPSDGLKRITLAVKPLKPTFFPAKVATAPQSTSAATKKPIPQAIPAAIGVSYEKLWESKPFSESDLNIIDHKNTNLKGSMSLDKGMLPDSVDHRHYFRDEVFQYLAWTARGATVDGATAIFHLVIKGVSHGEFVLGISHTTSTTSATYKQKNAMTRLRWGVIKPYIAKPELVGRSLTLYRDKADPTRFTIEID